MALCKIKLISDPSWFLHVCTLKSDLAPGFLYRFWESIEIGRLAVHVVEGPPFLKTTSLMGNLSV